MPGTSNHAPLRVSIKHAPVAGPSAADEPPPDSVAESTEDRWLHGPQLCVVRCVSRSASVSASSRIWLGTARARRPACNDARVDIISLRALSLGVSVRVCRLPSAAVCRGLRCRCAAAALPLRFLAAAVACPRVHAGTHYPGDALVARSSAQVPGRPWRAGGSLGRAEPACLTRMSHREPSIARMILACGRIWVMETAYFHDLHAERLEPGEKPV
jgi:hypothetical protein